MMLHLPSLLVLVLRGRMRVEFRRSPVRRWAVPVVYTVGVVVWLWRRRTVAREATLLPGEHVRLSPAPVFVSDTRAPAAPPADETPARAEAAAADEPAPVTEEGEAGAVASAPTETEPATAQATPPVETGDTALQAEASAPSTDTGDAEVAPSEPATPEDLTVIEGIGPRINEVLHEAGVLTLAQLADADPDQLRQSLRDANINNADPETWPEQARYAAAGDMDGLAAFTSTLRGGRAE